MTPIVFLPGMMCDGRLFAKQIEALQQYPTMVIVPTDCDTMSDLAQSVLQQAPAQFTLIGLSMGGIVAMEIVRQAKHRVKHLCLMDTNPLAEIPELQQRRELQINKVISGDLQAVIRDEMKPKYFYSENKPALDLCMDMALQLGEDVFIRQSKALKNRIDQTETLKQYENKTLILQGENDLLCPKDRHLLMHKLLANSQYVTIEQAGHLPTLEQPKMVNDALIEWLH